MRIAITATTIMALFSTSWVIADSSANHKKEEAAVSSTLTGTEVPASGETDGPATKSLFRKAGTSLDDKTRGGDAVVVPTTTTALADDRFGSTKAAPTTTTATTTATNTLTANATAKPTTPIDTKTAGLENRGGQPPERLVASAAGGSTAEWKQQAIKTTTAGSDGWTQVSVNANFGSLMQKAKGTAPFNFKVNGKNVELVDDATSKRFIDIVNINGTRSTDLIGKTPRYVVFDFPQGQDTPITAFTKPGEKTESYATDTGDRTSAKGRMAIVQYPDGRIFLFAGGGGGAAAKPGGDNTLK